MTLDDIHRIIADYDASHPRECLTERRPPEREAELSHNAPPTRQTTEWAEWIRAEIRAGVMARTEEPFAEAGKLIAELEHRIVKLEQACQRLALENEAFS